MNRDAVDLSVVLGKIKLKNPVMPSSGTFGYGVEFSDFLNLQDLGAIVVKSTTLRPRLGNSENRFIEIAGGAYLSCVGIQNVGVHRFIEDKLPYLRQFGTPVIVSIAGENIDEFIKITEILNKAEGIDAIQLNLGCPNVSKGGQRFSEDADITYNLIKGVRNTTALTIIPKLSGSLIPIADLAVICEKAGADAIHPGSATVTGMAIDINTRRSKLGKNLAGGLGGPWRKPSAIKRVWEVAQVVSIPIVGGGGITGPEDAIEFFIAGATAIEIGMYNLVDPKITIKTIAGIKQYLINNGMTSIKDIIGSVRLS
jgi:dihydroorotate dehydrogenase (NAD+) catalytic subunit